mmetsp:Transcript_17931/g.29916  ORF Transcript_17931/g.29916 Transcript_17931/m.29916 type:complete len:87 (-) Transcript_17931:1706-1966(-)
MLLASTDLCQHISTAALITVVAIVVAVCDANYVGHNKMSIKFYLVQIMHGCIRRSLLAHNSHSMRGLPRGSNLFAGSANPLCLCAH